MIRFTILISLFLLNSCTNEACKEELDVPLLVYNPCDNASSYKLTFGCYQIASEWVPAGSCLRGEEEFRQRQQLPTTGYTLTLNQATGQIAATSPGGRLLGTGTLRCNTGFLSYGPVRIDNEGCSYTTTRITALRLWNDDELSTTTLEVRESPSGSCGAQPSRCTSQSRIDLHK